MTDVELLSWCGNALLAILPSLICSITLRSLLETFAMTWNERQHVYVMWCMD